MCVSTVDSSANGPKRPFTPKKKIKEEEQGEEAEGSAEGPSVQVKEEEDCKEGVGGKPSKEKSNPADVVGVQKPPGDKYSPKVLCRALRSSGGLLVNIVDHILITFTCCRYIIVVLVLLCLLNTELRSSFTGAAGSAEVRRS